MSVKTISGPQRKFCEEVVRGRPYGEAYQIAYPDASPSAASSAGPRLFKNVQIQECIAELRDKADKMVGSGVLTRAEKRDFLARVVRAKPDEAAFENPDCEIVMTKMGPAVVFPSKLAALKLDNDLAGEGSEAEAQDALTGILERIMQ